MLCWKVPFCGRGLRVFVGIDSLHLVVVVAGLVVAFAMLWVCQSLCLRWVVEGLVFRLAFGLDLSMDVILGVPGCSNSRLLRDAGRLPWGLSSPPYD